MMRTLLATLAAAGVLAGCGLKGPLYLPDEKPGVRQPVKPLPPAPPIGSGRSL
jgi:predicted small lipoprotein YifL